VRGVSRQKNTPSPLGHKAGNAHPTATEHHRDYSAQAFPRVSIHEEVRRHVPPLGGVVGSRARTGGVGGLQEGGWWKGEDAHNRHTHSHVEHDREKRQAGGGQGDRGSSDNHTEHKMHNMFSAPTSRTTRRCAHTRSAEDLRPSILATIFFFFSHFWTEKSQTHVHRHHKPKGLVSSSSKGVCVGLRVGIGAHRCHGEPGGPVLAPHRVGCSNGARVAQRHCLSRG
jgi:hypothetical protein